jgi:hypothetical protein
MKNKIIDHRTGIAGGFLFGTSVYILCAIHLGQTGAEENIPAPFGDVIGWLTSNLVSAKGFALSVLILILFLFIRVRIGRVKTRERYIRKTFNVKKDGSRSSNLISVTEKAYSWAEWLAYSRIPSAIYSLSAFSFFINLYFELVYEKFHRDFAIISSIVCGILIIFLHAFIYKVNTMSEDGSLRRNRKLVSYFLFISLVTISAYSYFQFY